MIFISELDTCWSKDLATVVPGPKANGAQFRKAMCTLVLKHSVCVKKSCLVHSGSSLALSSLVLCLSYVSMQNFAPVSGLALDPYSSNASLGFPYPAQNSWPPSGLQAAGPYQQRGPKQKQRTKLECSETERNIFSTIHTIAADSVSSVRFQ